LNGKDEVLEMFEEIQQELADPQDLRPENTMKLKAL
jgi:hypothetical protein